MATNKEDSQIAEASLKTVENPTFFDSENDDAILSSYSLPSLPELTENSEEHQSLLTRSQYALVIFHGVADTYPTDSDIVCRYSLTDGVEATPGDRVVLFAVGWSSIKDYVVFEWAPIPEKDERDLTVVFKAADLPKDVNEFYQVCYVSNESAICGASVPFQVRTPHNEELTFALEEDMVVVRSSTAVAQDKLLKAQLDRENLNKKKLNLEKELRSLEDKHSLTLRRLDRLQETLSTSNSLNEELKKENARLSIVDKDMERVKKELAEALILLKERDQEKNKMQQDMDALNIDAKKFQTEIIHLADRSRDLEDQLFTAHKKTVALQMKQEKLESELATAMGDIARCEDNRLNSHKKIFMLDNELTVCKFNLNNAQVESLRLKAELEELGNVNTKLNEELRKAKESEEAHRRFYAEYSTGGNDRGRLIMENSRLQKSMEDMQLKISILEHEKLTLEQVLEDTLDAQKNVCSDHCTLEKRVAQLQFSLDEATSKNKVSRQKESHSGIVGSSCSSMEDEVKILSKLLEDSLKESEFRQQENMALRVQNEELELRISQDKSKLDEFVIVSTSHSRNAGDGPQEMGTNTVNPQGSVYELNAEIEKLRHRLGSEQKLTDQYADSLATNDKRINEMQKKIGEMETGFGHIEAELNFKIANLVSKNATLVAQEVQSRELKNEMQRITFMNGELLAENALLMEKIHEVKEKESEAQALRQSIEMEREKMRKLVEENHEELERRTVDAKMEVRIKIMEMEQKRESLEKELEGQKTMNAVTEMSYLKLTKEHNALMQRLTILESQVDEKCGHECCAEPKLNQIGQGVEHLLSAVEKLASSNEVRKGEQVWVSDAEDLKHRLQLARNEYEKVHAVMINYRAKYNDLKRKYYMKKLRKVTSVPESD